jgi:hypothetical protein
MLGRVFPFPGGLTMDHKLSAAEAAALLEQFNAAVEAGKAAEPETIYMKLRLHDDTILALTDQISRQQDMIGGLLKIMADHMDVTLETLIPELKLVDKPELKGPTPGV